MDNSIAKVVSYLTRLLIIILDIGKEYLQRYYLKKRSNMIGRIFLTFVIFAVQ